jgi:hypothetical protein
MAAGPARRRCCTHLVSCLCCTHLRVPNTDTDLSSLARPCSPTFTPALGPELSHHAHNDSSVVLAPTPLCDGQRSACPRARSKHVTPPSETSHHRPAEGEGARIVRQWGVRVGIPGYGVGRPGQDSSPLWRLLLIPPLISSCFCSFLF